MYAFTSLAFSTMFLQPRTKLLTTVSIFSITQFITVMGSQPHFKQNAINGRKPMIFFYLFCNCIAFITIVTYQWYASCIMCNVISNLIYPLCAHRTEFWSLLQFFHDTVRTLFVSGCYDSKHSVGAVTMAFICKIQCDILWLVLIVAL